MRLHFLASTLVRGGAETMAVALSRRLAARGHRVRWTLLREPGELGTTLAGALRPETGIAPGRAPWPALSRLRARLAGDEAVYVLDHQNAVVLAAIAAPWAGVPRRLLAVHTTGLWGGRPSLTAAMRLAMRRFTAVLALSEVHRRYLIETERTPPEKVRVVPNGIDLERFLTLPGRQAARRRIGLADDVEAVVSVAMLRPEKNHRMLLEAAAGLGASRPRLVVVLLGDGPERIALEARAARDDLRGRVRFLGRRDDVPDLLPAFDAFVLASHPAVETQPVAVLEAMAAGLPVVATRVGDLPDMLEDGAAGILVESGDVSGLGGALRDLLDDPRRREELAARGRKRVEAYGLDAATTALEAALGGAG